MPGKRARPVRGQAERERTSTFALAPHRSAEPTRLFKHTLGWTAPKLRDPESADRWTWLILTVHTQLRLARALVEDQRRPWERPVTQPRRLTPARVPRGFRNLHPTTTRPQPHRNPPDPVPDARSVRPTATQQSVTRSARPSNAT